MWANVSFTRHNAVLVQQNSRIPGCNGIFQFLLDLEYLFRGAVISEVVIIVACKQKL